MGEEDSRYDTIGWVKVRGMGVRVTVRGNGECEEQGGVGAGA